MRKDSRSFRNTETLRGAAIASLVLMLLMLVGSVVFYKERLLFSDATHNLFRIINYNTLQVEAERYGLAITQIFPLIGARLHLPLSWLMLLYSVSFFIFYSGTVAALVLYFKEYALAILYGLYMTIFVSDAYYYLNNEGIALLFLAMALNSKLAAKNAPAAIAIPVFITTNFLALWTHPLVMLPAIFLWFFLWFGKMSWNYTKKQSILYGAIILVLSFIKYYQGKHHGYDSGKIEMLTLFKPGHLLHLFSAPQFKFFVWNSISDFWLFVVLLLAGWVAMAKYKKYWLLLLSVCFTGGYLLLLFITYWDVDYNKFYLEIEYMPLAVISTAPFVYYILARTKAKTAALMLSIVFAIRIMYILDAGTAYSDRLLMLDKINLAMAGRGLTKVIITPPMAEAEKALIMNWGAPAESMITSKLKRDVPQRTFIFMDTNQIKSFNTSGKDTLLGCFAKYTNLNATYFALDTTCTYTTISYEELMK